MSMPLSVIPSFSFEMQPHSPSELENFKINIRNRRYELLEWATDEIPIKSRDKKFEINKEICSRPLFKVLMHLYQHSCFGNFLKDFNKSHKQDKIINHNKFGIERWEHDKLDIDEKSEWQTKNSFTIDPTSILIELIETNEIIDLKTVKGNIKILRLKDHNIDCVDDDLKNYKKLKFLILSSNFIKDISGKDLPKSLKFLELFANYIEDLGCLVEKPKFDLYHLGLGRNRLSDNSNFHLLVKNQSFKHLHTLDFSDNDICDIEGLVDQLKTLYELRALLLEGNPCSYSYTYVHVILKSLPKLIYLDNTKILDEDRNPEERFFTEDEDGIIFTCYRVMGLLPPPKEAKMIHNYYLEVTLPLLEEIKVKIDSVENIEEPSSSRIPSTVRSSKKFGKSVYESPNEYDETLEKNSTSFKGSRETKHQKIIKFTDPDIVVTTSETNLRTIRDTFRSKVNVKLIYLKTTKAKKSKATKELYKGKDSFMNVATATDFDEIVLKKVTVADFYCNLHTINWSEKYIDFYWVDSKECGDTAYTIDGNLQALEYKEKGKGKDKPKKGKDKSEIDIKQNIPEVLTIQVGFGVMRSNLNI